MAATAPRNEAGQKLCTRCREYKDDAAFGRKAIGADGLTPVCRQCSSARQAENRQKDPERFREYSRRYTGRPEVVAARAAYKRRWAKENPEAARAARRASRLKRYYNLTPQQYDEMLAAQGGLCRICSAEAPSGEFLHVDHDHESGLVRALLCGSCNVMLGHARERPDILESAADYIRSFSEDDTTDLSADAS